MSIINPDPAPAENPVVVTPEVVAPASVETPSPAIPDGYYPREEVEKLRRENQAYRERYQPFERTFGEMDEEAREAYLQLARMHNDDDPNTRKQLADTLGFALPPDESPVYLTQQDLDARLAEREQQTAQTQAMEGIYLRAENLGYRRDTREMVSLLWELNQMETPDIEAADKIIKADRQKTIDDFMKKKTEQAETIGMLETPGVAGRPDMEIKSLADSRKAAEARLAGIRSGQG